MVSIHLKKINCNDTWCIFSRLNHKFESIYFLPQINKKIQHAAFLKKLQVEICYISLQKIYDMNKLASSEKWINSFQVSTEGLEEVLII